MFLGHHAPDHHDTGLLPGAVDLVPLAVVEPHDETLFSLAGLEPWHGTGGDTLVHQRSTALDCRPPLGVLDPGGRLQHQRREPGKVGKLLPSLLDGDVGDGLAQWCQHLGAVGMACLDTIDPDGLLAAGAELVEASAPAVAEPVDDGLGIAGPRVPSIDLANVDGRASVAHPFDGEGLTHAIHYMTCPSGRQGGRFTPYLKVGAPSARLWKPSGP